MQKVPGVYGVRAFVKRHTVEIAYNPEQTNTEKIRETIFTPTTVKFTNPKAGADSVELIRIGVDQLFDRMDMVYFGNILKQIDGIYGFDAEYACPVEVILYVDPAAPIAEEWLQDSIEVKETSMKASGGEIRKFPVNYKLITFIFC